MKRSSGKTLFDFFGKRQKSQERLQSHTALNIAVVPDRNSELTEVSVPVTPALDEPQRISSVTESTVEIVRPTPSSANVSSESVLPTQSNSSSQLQFEPRDPIHGRQAASQFFKNGPFQPNIDKYPETKGRKFRSMWYTGYNWLEYSIAADKAFCFPCRLFGSTGCYVISNGFKNWKKAVQRFKEHEKTSSHLNALQRWQEGLKTKESVLSKISTHHQEVKKKS